MDDAELERQIRAICGVEEGISTREGRVLLAAVFDGAFYRHHCDDLSHLDATLEHYLEVGWRKSRDPSAAFDTRDYLVRNPHLGPAGICPLLH